MLMLEVGWISMPVNWKKSLESSARESLREMAVIMKNISVIANEGMGPTEPVASNETAEECSQNRRVEREIKIDEARLPKDKLKM